MAKKSTIKNVKTSVKSGFDSSRFYFSKPTSVVLITTYVTILLLVLGTLGFSKIINPKNLGEQGVPSLPSSEPFAFLPADNIEVPELGDVEEKPEEKIEAKEPEQAPEKEFIKEPVAEAVTATVQNVEIPKEIVREVVRTIEVPKEVVKEVPVETKKEPEQTYFENASAPEGIPYTPPETTYENFPDIEEDTEEVSNDTETTPGQ
ncbi:hypothetical protein IKG48_02965 [Candidatus Saccharibacteria bacterium]|nr:hypothetical protein [Candidatus Saccharibacteria bacterium]